jgi:two-component system NtrC family response regulator
MQHFLNKLGPKEITSAAKKTLMEYNWPGNVRELINILERATIVAETSIDVEHLPLEIQTPDIEKGFINIPEEGIKLDQVEREFILSALQKAAGNKTQAAQYLGISRRRLYSMMERFGIGG